MTPIGVVEVFDLMSAIDYAFMLFFILNLEYPLQTKDIWNFLQSVVFGVPCSLTVTCDRFLRDLKNIESTEDDD